VSWTHSVSWTEGLWSRLLNPWPRVLPPRGCRSSLNLNAHSLRPLRVRRRVRVCRLHSGLQPETRTCLTSDKVLLLLYGTQTQPGVTVRRSDSVPTRITRLSRRRPPSVRASEPLGLPGSPSPRTPIHRAAAHCSGPAGLTLQPRSFPTSLSGSGMWRSG
jgi:hypothetical protein